MLRASIQSNTYVVVLLGSYCYPGSPQKKRNVLDLGVDVLLLPLVVFIYAVHKKTDHLVETEVEILHFKKYQFECCIIFVFRF